MMVVLVFSRCYLTRVLSMSNIMQRAYALCCRHSTRETMKFQRKMSPHRQPKFTVGQRWWRRSHTQSQSDEWDVSTLESLRNFRGINLSWCLSRVVLGHNYYTPIRALQSQYLQCVGYITCQCWNDPCASCALVAFPRPSRPFVNYR